MIRWYSVKFRKVSEYQNLENDSNKGKLRSSQNTQKVEKCQEKDVRLWYTCIYHIAIDTKEVISGRNSKDRQA
jgi:hypothetical protein